MAATRDLADLSETELLAHGEELDRVARSAECGKVLLAYQWAVTHPGERVPRGEKGKPGRERARRLGAEGTPTVAEFAPAALGGRLRISPYGAARLMGDAIDIMHRLPGIRAAVESGAAEVRYARHVAQQTRELSAEEAAVVDEEVAAYVDGSISWHRFELVVAAAVINAAPEVARRRALAKLRPFVGLLRGREHNSDGASSLLVRGDTATIAQIKGALDARAAELGQEDGNEETLHERRLRALLELTSGPGVMPQVQLHVHTYADPDGTVTDVARVEGHGPVTTDWVRGFLGPRCSFTVRPVLDIAGLAPVDAYEIPSRHRQAVRIITPADTFPFANCLSRSMDVDHTEPWRPPPHETGPPSRIGNYGPMTRRHHRIKTHGRWEVRQPFPGVYLWRDPYGAHYLVDTTGTRRLPAASVA